MFGVGSVPIASYFGLPQGASADTRFSPQARGMLAQGEEYAREQAAMDAERAAEELLGGAADMTDEEIQGQLTQNPRMFGTQAIQPLSGYMQFRQSTTPQTDVTLGPILREKIQDPYHREQFEKRMLEGASANDAFDAYRTDEYNMKFETALAEAGVPETEYAKLKTPSGKFIPSAVARAQQMAKTKAAEAKSALTRRTSDDPIDRKIDAYERAMKRREDIFKATGREAELAKDQTYLGYIAKIEEAEKAKFAAVDPVADIEIDSVTPKSVPEATVLAAPEAPPVFDITISPEENKARVEQYKLGSEERAAKQKVADSIASAWTKKKLEVIDKLEPFYTTTDELRAVANSIVSNRLSPVASTRPYGGANLAAGGVGNPELYVEYLAKKLGMKPEGKAFREPESGSWNRLGTQTVTNRELLVEWAKSFLEADKAVQSAQSAPPTSDTPPSANIKAMKPRE
jgi:hypothetical protein